MHSTLNKWITELEDETEIVASDDINEEANSNMVTFEFNDLLLQEWGKESVAFFLTCCADLYQRKSQGLNMIFYAWLDEQAGQIRISAVNQKHGKLPFDCKLNEVDLVRIVSGIYTHNSGLFTNGVLDVWQQSI